jgi:predicted O-methyltransferase YrrM
MKKTYETFKEFLKTSGITESVMSRELGPNPSNWICDHLQDHELVNILEIGRSKGHSLALFKYLWPNSKVVSVDVIYHKEVGRVLDYFSASGSIDIVNGDITRFNGDQIFDLVLIDGDHSYQGAKLDWDSIQKNIAPGSIVLFDDLGHGGGCGKVFYDIKNDYKTEVIKNQQGIECHGVVYI